MTECSTTLTYLFIKILCRLPSVTSLESSGTEQIIGGQDASPRAIEIQLRAVSDVKQMSLRSRGRNEGKACFPLINVELHLLDFDALIRADFYARKAPNALSSLKGIGLAISAHLINLDRADVHAFSTTGAAIHVHID